LAEYSGGDIKLNPEAHNDFAWINISDAAKYQKVHYLQDCLVKNSQYFKILRYFT
jgi:hypothetical protein